VSGRANALSQAQFRFGIASPAQLPPDQGSEVAFAGRSNAGKSSALNALTARRKLAFVSKTPGRTQQINYYAVGDEDRFLVDLPGYGYAEVPGAVKARWDQLTGAYLSARRALRGIVLIMDVRRPFMPADRAWLRAMVRTDCPVLVLLTKADKLTHGRAQQQLQLAQSALAEYPLTAEALLFSSVSGLNVATARAQVLNWLSITEPGSPREVASR
jgi:GTP-binding protein